MKIEANEVEIKGAWKHNGAKIVEDSVSKRINWLIKNLLNKIGADPSGWISLYQDPSDKRYWELSYPQSEMEGGGAPCLTLLTKEEAESKYSL